MHEYPRRMKRGSAFPLSELKIRLVLLSAGLLEEGCRIIEHARRLTKINAVGIVAVNSQKSLGNHEGKYG